jgi:hypothetical protein
MSGKKVRPEPFHSEKPPPTGSLDFPLWEGLTTLESERTPARADKPDRPI